MINELERKISTRDMRAGQGPALLSRLGIPLAPNKNGLACQCDPRGDCTCGLTKSAITRDAKRPGIGDPRLIVAVMALRHLDERLSRLESLCAGNPQAAQGPQQIVAAAKAKADDFLAARYSEKVAQSILESHQKRADEAYKQAHGDPSEPGHAQPQHPLGKQRMTGDSEFVTPEQARQLFKQRDAEQAARRKAFEHEAAQNKAFNDNQHAMVRLMKNQIDGAVKERWK